MSGGQKFSKIDLAQAYLQMEVDDDSKKYLTINTTKGLFAYNRLPFGIASAPALFQRAMEQILQGCQGTQVYFDDIMVTGVHDDEHLENLEAVLDKLAAYGLHLRKKKCDFMQPSMEYLGHIVDSEGHHMDTSKVQAVVDAPAPKDVHELKSLLGMVNYYARFVPNLSTALHPLNRLLGKGVQWKWDNSCESAFNKVKSALTSAKVLVHYSADSHLILACDASAYGIGAVISHIMEDGSERPIAFTSRSLTKTERHRTLLANIAGF